MFQSRDIVCPIKTPQYLVIPEGKCLTNPSCVFKIKFRTGKTTFPQ